MKLLFDKIVDESSHIVFAFDKTTLATVYANKKAIALLADGEGKIDLSHVFQEPLHSSSFHYKSILEQLQVSKVAELFDVLIRSNQQVDFRCTLQAGYASEDRSLIFLHLSIPEVESAQKETFQNEENEYISNYFNVIQSLSKDFLYRFNIETRTLYRNESTAQLYGISPVVEDYPNADALEGVFHPDDMELYIAFIQEVLQGKEGSVTARMCAPSGQFEYHNITFKELKRSDGTVKEMIANAVNVHTLHETEEKLENINEYFNILQSLSKNLLYRLDIEKRILYRNEQTSKFYGIPSEVRNYPDLEGLRRIFHPDDMDAYIEYIEHVMKGNDGVHTARMTAPSGLFEYHRITFRQVRRPDGTIKEMVGTAENIQELMELETKASYDLLTKCYNKISFQEEVTKVLLEAPEGSHALLFLDLDEFKYVNDNLGHAFGDKVIKVLGKRLRENVGKEDFVGRVGGDEFIIFMKHVGSDDILLGKSKIILHALAEDICDSLHCHTMHGSVGISRFPEHGTSYEELYHHADLALYQSKHKGKNTATIYESES